MKVSMLLTVMSITRLPMNLKAAFFSASVFKPQLLSCSEMNAGIGVGGYILYVGNSVIPSLSQIALNSLHSTEPILNIPLFSIANFSYCPWSLLSALLHLGLPPATQNYTIEMPFSLLLVTCFGKFTVLQIATSDLRGLYIDSAYAKAIKVLKIFIYVLN